MSTKNCSRVAALAGAAFLVAAAGCGPSSPGNKTGTNPGQTGTTFDVTVFRTSGGTVTSSDGRINCGTSGALCGPVSYAWTDVVRLVATPDAGMMFGTWAGDCTGRNQLGGEYVCLLDTVHYGADKYVVPVWGPAGLADHPPFTDHTIHGPAYLANVTTHAADTFNCAGCHGANYAGAGIAPSCNDCHEKNGHPNWQSDCTFCHGAPPPPPPSTFPTMTHPRVSNDITACFGCHQGTVDQNGAIIPGGDHLNGQIDATGGHAEGYNDPKIHGRDYFSAIASDPAAPYCTGCHGTNYEVKIAAGRSCNTCHAEPTSSIPPGGGWSGTDWKSNCTFCHGARTIAYAAPGDLAKAAPPDAISQRLDGAPALDRSGAHANHLKDGAYAKAFNCNICHEVPNTLTHIGGRDVPATVLVRAPSDSEASPTAYDRTSGTCATSCHFGASPTWSVQSIQCDGCHAIPTESILHQGLTSDTKTCHGCHDQTIDVNGNLNLAAGTHINGTIDVITGHADGFATPSVHGLAYLNFVGGNSTLDCTQCHGTSLGLCNGCHSEPGNGGWVSWQTNCTFCHGTRTPTYTAAAIKASAPPDDINQRLAGGTPTATRTGKHSGHLSSSQPAAYPSFPCATCHPVPTDVTHISGARRADVAFNLGAAFPNLSAQEIANLPNSNPPVPYDRSTNRCSTYCHGSAAWGGKPPTSTIPAERQKGTAGYNPLWSTSSAAASCDSCHGQPPPTGKTIPPNGYCSIDFYPDGCSLHEWHYAYNSSNNLDGCTACHNNFVHVNGFVEINFLPQQAPGKPAGTLVSGTYDRAGAGTCTVNCHPDTRTWKQ